MAKTIKMKINNIEVSANLGSTVLQVAQKSGIKIPTLCYLKNVNEIGACRICVVEVVGMKNLVTACNFPVREGLEILTNSEKVLKSRKGTVELMLSNHERKCLSCVRSNNCELQRLSNELGCVEEKYDGEKTQSIMDTSTSYLVRDNSKCVLCRRCSSVCSNIQLVGVIGANDRGFDTHIGTGFDDDLEKTKCIACGQCIIACPTGALSEKDDINEVISALSNKDKRVIVSTAPAVRVALGEEFGLKIGTNVEGKMVTALKTMGFDDVFDIDFSADLTIMEEGAEFLDRLNNKGTLPMITSCCPSWIKYIEQYHGDMIDNLSSCKSPQQMFGAITKSYYAKKLGIKPEDIYLVSIMPCVAKKYEKSREEMQVNGVRDIDAVLTTRELARMLKRCGINLPDLKPSKFDDPLGVSTGAGLIFGATGGVMEAALRTVASIVEKKELVSLDFKEVRGTNGIKEASYILGGTKVNVAVASGIENANKLLELVKSGEKDYHFIEIMSCPGGCVNGGGQPIHDLDTLNNVDIKKVRASSIYKGDLAKTIRKSHENPVIKELYDSYLEKPNSHKAHELLHTTYKKR